MGLVLAGWPVAAVGQTVISPDVVAGRALGTTVGQAGVTYTISGGTRAGGNLFHSFTQFDLGAGDTARWVGGSDAATVNNVINRVTGGQASRINGTIDSTALPNATFYFVNPAGIVFGPGAQVNVPSVAHFSTAGELRFANGERFAIATPNGSTLSVATPEAWGFVGGQGAISISGVGPDLQDIGPAVAAPETTLTFAAANLSIDDSEILTRGLDLIAVGDGSTTVRFANPLATRGGGRIEISSSLLGAVDSSVGARSLRVNGGALDIQTSGLFSSGDLFVQASERIDGIATSFQVASLTGQAAGTIVIRTPSIFLDTARLIAGAIDDGSPGSILVETGDLLFVNSEVVNDAADGVGAARGEIRLRSTGDLVLLDTAVRSNATGAADGGVINIEGRDVEITGAGASVESDTFGFATGDAGQVTVTAGTLFMSAKGSITSTSSSEGAGGNVSVTVKDLLRMQSASGIRSDAIDVGGAGSVTIVAGRIEMVDQASIASEAVSGTGDAGKVSITAGKLFMSDAIISSGSKSSGEGGDIFIGADEIVLDGAGRDFTAITGETFGSGSAGDVFIQTNTAILRGGGRITSDARGSGDAGNIAVVAKDLLLERGGQIASDSYDLGDAGDVVIAADKLVVDGGGFEATFISSDALQGGDAGTVSVVSKSILVDNNGFISSDTYSSGRGGDLVISADVLNVRNFGEIRSQTRSEGDAGSVNIEAKTITLEGGGNILSEAIGRNADGRAGSVILVADSLTVGDGGSISTSTAGAGDAGEVAIEAKTLTVDGGRIASSAEIGATGSANALFLTAETLRVVNSGAISTLSTNPNPAGLITIATGELRVDGLGSIIGSENQSGNPGFGGLMGPGGDAGTVLIDAANITISNGGRISTNSFAGAAGGIGININRPGLFVLEGAEAPGVIQTSSGPGTGGAITIVDPLAIISNGGRILALGQQRGANVQIQSRYFINSTDRLNVVDVDGDFRLQTGLYDVSSGTVSRDLSVLDASKVLRGQCPAARSTGAVSQLITRPVGPYAREAQPAAPSPSAETPSGGCR